MGLGNATERLVPYFKRLQKGKVQKIKTDDVEKVLKKLKAKQEILKTELQEATKSDKKERISKKLATAAEQIERAKWLLKEIGDDR